ncbi:hypothetical protein [Frankia tisae]|nr:hypothetical protein [Frankia tisae]
MTAIVVHRKLPAQRPKLQVVFEGTPDYYQRFAELNDGTFWPTS